MAKSKVYAGGLLIVLASGSAVAFQAYCTREPRWALIAAVILLPATISLASLVAARFTGSTSFADRMTAQAAFWIAAPILLLSIFLASTSTSALLRPFPPSDAYRFEGVAAHIRVEPVPSEPRVLVLRVWLRPDQVRPFEHRCGSTGRGFQPCSNDVLHRLARSDLREVRVRLVAVSNKIIFAALAGETAVDIQESIKDERKSEWFGAIFGGLFSVSLAFYLIRWWRRMRPPESRVGRRLSLIRPNRLD